MKVAEITEAVAGMANNFTPLGVDEGGTELLLEVAPEEMTKEELLAPEPERTAEEGARQKEKCG